MNATVESNLMETALAQRAMALVHKFGKELFWIRSWADRLEREAAGNRTAARRARAIRELSEEMCESANGFLTDSKLGLAPKHSRLDAVVRRAVLTVERTHGTDRIDCVLNPELSGCGVDERLMDVLVILLDNALHASPSDRSVHLTCNSDPALRLLVIDQGVGMTPAVLEACWELGFSTRPEEGGHGVGLTTARNLMAAMGGHLAIESQPGVGTIATVWLSANELSESPRSS